MGNTMMRVLDSYVIERLDMGHADAPASKGTSPAQNSMDTMIGGEVTS